MNRKGGSSMVNRREILRLKNLFIIFQNVKNVVVRPLFWSVWPIFDQNQARSDKVVALQQLHCKDEPSRYIRGTECCYVRWETNPSVPTCLVDWQRMEIVTLAWWRNVGWKYFQLVCIYKKVNVLKNSFKGIICCFADIMHKMKSIF